MILEWRLRHRDGTDCSHYREPFEYYALAFAENMDILIIRDGFAPHPAQLIQFETGQEMCLGVDFETGFEYWVKRVE